MLDTPITIILPVKHCVPRYLKAAVQSVLDQSSGTGACCWWPTGMSRRLPKHHASSENRPPAGRPKNISEARYWFLAKLDDGVCQLAKRYGEPVNLWQPPKPVVLPPSRA